MSILFFDLKKSYEPLNELYEELRVANAQSDELYTTLSMLIDDNRELRKMLNLPDRNYPDMRDEPLSEVSNSEEDNTNFLLYFQGVERILEQQEQERIILERESILSSVQLQNIIQSNSLKLEYQSNVLTLEDKFGRLFIQINLDVLDDANITYHILHGDGSEEHRSSIDAEWLERNIAVLREHYRTYDVAKEELFGILNSSQLQRMFTAKGLNSVKSKNTEMPATLSVRKQGHEFIHITLDPKDYAYVLGEHRFEDSSELSQYVHILIRTTTFLTPGEIRLEQNDEKLQNIFQDRGFKSHLQNQGLHLAETRREDGEHIFYDFLDSDNQIVGSFALQKINGSIWLMDKDGTAISSLDSLSNSSELPELELQGPELMEYTPSQQEEDRAFLLLGLHENMTDTIILAYFISEIQQIMLFSIPRDLYYRGKKINSIYLNFGPEQLRTDLEQITQLEIDHYFSIDMFAFIDAVNAMGGIDFVFEEPLIDPNYRVKENARWATLYYPAGLHHLDGIATLRVVRSRGTSSDFDRAQRQQKVLTLLHQKIQNISLRDAKTVYSLLRILFSYIDSDVGLVDCFRYVRQYSHFNIAGQIIIDNSNVLYNTYTKIRHLKEGDPMPEYKGQWILLPREDNWELIPRFIQSHIQTRRDAFAAIP